MEIISWNVLYRAYEQKYNPGSTILREYPSDTTRIKQQIDILKQHVTKHTIVCLQECGEELLTLLHDTFASTHSFFCQYIAETEYIVILAPISAEFCAEKWEIVDGVRGAIAISNDNYRIFNVHLKPQKFAETYLLGYIKCLPSDKQLFVAGDFNEQLATVRKRLKDRYEIVNYGITYKQKQIDYIIRQRDSDSSSNILVDKFSADGTSDHCGIKWKLVEKNIVA